MNIQYTVQKTTERKLIKLKYLQPPVCAAILFYPAEPRLIKPGRISDRSRTETLLNTEPVNENYSLSAVISDISDAHMHPAHLSDQLSHE